MPTTERPSFTVNIHLTGMAAEQVKQFMQSEELSSESAGLRVSVMPGGCSGFKYSLNLEETPLDDDVIAESQGIRLFVDAFSAQYLEGTSIDFQSGVNGSGFSFSNPSATGGCGCGQSFSA